jgi:hypothetical protein
MKNLASHPERAAFLAKGKRGPQFISALCRGNAILLRVQISLVLATDLGKPRFSIDKKISLCLIQLTFYE